MPLNQYPDVLTGADVAANEAALRNLQGNILVSFAKDAALYGVIRFTSGATCARAALKVLASEVTPAWQQLFGPKGPSMMSLALSATGFHKLTLEYTFRDSFEAGFASFLKSMGAATSQWQKPFDPVDRIDALAAIACDQADDANLLKDKVEQAFRQCGKIDWIPGKVRRRGKFPTEHFGFADGISNPVFLESELRGTQYPDGARPNASPALVLRPDPWNVPDEFGSYLAFLKLEQDVDGFNEISKHLAQELSGNLGQPSSSQLTRAKSFIIGRDPNGVPLVNPGAGGDLNDFDFTADPGGLVCPLAAHIRKQNPRKPNETHHRIARRGVLYEEQEARGVLFQCYQGDLTTQFEHLFQVWGNGVDLPETGAGVDPLIGEYQVAPGTTQMWPLFSGGGKIGLDIRSLVKVRGGEYFYVPSIPFFTRL